MSSYQYMDSYHKDEMISHPSYLNDNNIYNWKHGLYIETMLRLFAGTLLTWFDNQVIAYIGF